MRARVQNESAAFQAKQKKTIFNKKSMQAPAIKNSLPVKNVSLTGNGKKSVRTPPQCSSSKKSGRSSSKSPIEQLLLSFEKDVVKKLNDAVSSVTINLEAVSKQLMRANESLSESLNVVNISKDTILSDHKEGVQKQSQELNRDIFNTHMQHAYAIGNNSSSRFMPVAKFHDEDHDSVGNEEFENFVLSDTVQLQFTEKQNGTFEISASRPRSPFLFDAFNDMPNEGSDDDNVDFESAGSDLELPEKILDLIETGVKEKVLGVVRDKVIHYSR